VMLDDESPALDGKSTLKATHCRERMEVGIHKHTARDQRRLVSASAAARSATYPRVNAEATTSNRRDCTGSVRHELEHGLLLDAHEGIVGLRGVVLRSPGVRLACVQVTPPASRRRRMPCTNRESIWAHASGTFSRGLK
jgi:hypothetical protein